MTKIYNYLYTLLCVCSFAIVTSAQEKLWFAAGDKLIHSHKDGSNQTTSMNFSRPEDGATSKYGTNPFSMIQISTGEIFLVNSFGGVDEGGTVLRIARDGIHKIRDLDYNSGYQYFTEGKDGYIYGTKSSALDAYILRFRPDGSNYIDRPMGIYGSAISELVTTTDGQIIGTSKFHLFRFRSDMSGVDKLYAYQKATGSNPIGKLIQSTDGFLYGATKTGGLNNYGVIYKVKPSGADYTVLHQFNNANGRYPDRGLTEDANGNLYGVTTQGGQHSKGVLFKIRKDGTAYEILYHFQNPRQDQYFDSPSRLHIDGDGNIYGLSPGYYDRQLFRFSTITKSFTALNSSPGLSNAYLFKDVTPAIEVIRPQDGAINIAANTGYQTNSIVGSLTYTVDVSKIADFSSGVLTTTHTSPDAIPSLPLSANTKYYARAKSSLWPNYGRTTSFSTGTSQEVYSILSNPPNGSLNAEAPVLKVTARTVTGVKRYTIQLAKTNDFTGETLMMTSTVDFQRTLTFTGLGYNTQYYARVKTDLNTAYGPITTFKTKVEQFSFVTTPLNGASGADFHVSNVSAQAIPSAQHYTLEVSTSSTFTTMLKTYYSLERGQNNFLVRDLQPAVKYYTRVRTDISTTWGPIKTFTTRSRESGIRLWGVTTAGGENEGGTLYSFSVDSLKLTKHHDAPSENVYEKTIIDGGDGFYGGSSGYYPDTYESYSEVFRYTQSGQYQTSVRLKNGGFIESMIASSGAIYQAVDGWDVSGKLVRIDKNFTTLKEFYYFKKPTGHHPFASLIEHDGYLYSTTYTGGAYDWGTIYRIKADGSNHQVIFSFRFEDTIFPGEITYGNDGYLYGITTYGPGNVTGAVYKVKLDGSDFRILHAFEGYDYGSSPHGRLLLKDGIIYGAASFGGNSLDGTIFRINTDGGNFSVIHEFNGVDGSGPNGSLSMDHNGYLYGAAQGGGVNNDGVLFRLKTDGTAFQKLYDFTDLTGSSPSGNVIVRDDTFAPVSGTQTAFLESDLVDVYPNPSVQTFVVKPNKTSLQPIQIEITDFTGTTIHKSLLTQDGVEIGDGLPKGMYLLKIISQNKTYMQRLVKK